MLNLEQLKAAMAAGEQRFALLRKKYPELKGYLVLSLPTGQTGLDSSPVQILGEFPAMVIDDAAKASVLKFQSRPPEASAGTEAERKAKEEKRLKELEQLASHLSYDEKCQIEIRFSGLNYELIWKLQGDDLVDRKLAPQTKASIRIVLGTLAHFGEAQAGV